MPDKITKALVRIWQRFLEALEFASQSRIFPYAMLIILGIAATSVSTVTFQHLPSSVQVGEIASRDIKANRNYEIVDEEATDKFKQEAMSGVLPVFDLDTGLSDEISGLIAESFKAARVLYVSWLEQERSRLRVQRPPAEGEEFDAFIEQLQQLFTDRLGIQVSSQQIQALISDRFSTRSEAVIIDIIKRAMGQPLIAERGVTDMKWENGAVIRKIKVSVSGSPAEAGEETVVNDVNTIRTVDEIRQQITPVFVLRSGIRDQTTAEAVAMMVGNLIEPNCTLNLSETNKRREAAASNTKSAIIKLNAGEMIIREGARFEPWHLKVLNGIRKEKRHGSYHVEFIGSFLLIMMIITAPFLLLKKFFRRIKIERGDYILMAIVGLSLLLLLRFLFAIAPAVRDQLIFSMETSTLYYAVPIAGGAMLLRMFLGAEVSFAFALVISILCGLFIETDIHFAAYAMITGMVAIMAISNVDRRSQILKAGLFTGAAGSITVIGIFLISSASSATVFSFSDAIWGIFFAFISGIGCAIYAMLVAPIIESLSGYTSDIKLLELANLNHPLLRELIVRAPGTYHHSHVVGLLAEAAAQEIGANALLVRVGAYYHDIGKLKKPLYFIENTKPGESRHERLTPHMSSLIVSSHVKDGTDLAVAAKLPRVLIDMIPQHHGTRRIGFFYDKAKSLEDPTVMKIDPKDFEYPGPKPQTREAAILMLADVTEAAVRALKEKSPARIEQMVQKVIHDIFNETQLDECDLTLRDLNGIRKAFERTLLGIYHLRIEYVKEMEHGKEEAGSGENGKAEENEADKPAHQESPETH